VGDHQQIPAFNKSGHVTDLTYMCWTTGDNLPDCYYGRFSAQSVVQLTPQIEKTLMYEQYYTMPDKTYLNKAVLVAGTDNGSSNPNQQRANGQMKYLNDNYVNTTQGYDTVYHHKFNCSSQATAIRNEIGQGVGFANYTAHCSSSGWSDPKFETSHIASMQNKDKYGLMIGNCCESSRFEENECFAERLLRVPDKGAVGYIGGSDLTYWVEDYYWAIGMRSNNSNLENPIYNATNLGAYDRLFHTHNEPYSDWFVTNGAIITAGNMAVQASTSTLKNYYWEIYHLMGDPSVMTYFSEPEQLTVNVNQTLSDGQTSLDVHTVPYAYVALTGNNGATLHAAGFTNQAGDVTLNFAALTPDNYELAVWAQNYVISFTPLSPTGISTVEPDNDKITLYPNPAVSTVTLSTEGVTICQWELLDYTGRIVAQSGKIETTNAEINISALANGLYAVKIMDDNQHITVKKFIKR
jgi:hypothetical protein